MHRETVSCGAPDERSATGTTAAKPNQSSTMPRLIDSMKRLYGDRSVTRSTLTLAELQDGLRAAGFEHIDKVTTDGTGRMPARGKGPNNTSAVFRNTPDGMACHWKDFATGDKGTVFAGGSKRISQGESRRLAQEAKARRKQQDAERLDAQHKAAEEANRLWALANVSGHHPYITKKKLNGLHGARVNPLNGDLLIGIGTQVDGLINLQRITRNGDKLFLKGGRIKGAYSVIGSLDEAETILICEGWATGATLHEDTSYPVVVALNAGNLMAVSKTLRCRFPDGDLVICGDDDRLTKGNPGRTKATEVAHAIDARVCFPILCGCCTCKDFNDAANCPASIGGNP